MKFIKDYWGLAFAAACFIAYVFYSKNKLKKSQGAEKLAINEKPSGIPDPVERPKPIDDFGTHPTAEVKPPINTTPTMPPIYVKPADPKPAIITKPPVQDHARPPIGGLGLASKREDLNTTKQPAKFAVSRSVFDLR